MDDLIILRCPQTGVDVQTLLYKQEHHLSRPARGFISSTNQPAKPWVRTSKTASVGTLRARFPGYGVVRYQLLPMQGWRSPD